MSQYIGYQQVGVAGVVLTAANLNIPPECSRAHLQATNVDIFYTMDENPVNPTAITGMVLQQGLAPEWFEVEDLARIRFIAGGAGNAFLNIHYYGTANIP